MRKPFWSGGLGRLALFGSVAVAVAAIIAITGSGTPSLAQTTPTVTVTTTPTVTATTTQTATATATATATQTVVPLIVQAGGPYNGTVGMAIIFNAVVANAFNPQFRWDFGDGSQDQGQAVSHTYQSAGAFTVSVAVIDQATGRTGAATTTATITGNGSATATPTATPGATATPGSGATESVQLFSGCNNVSITWPDGTVTSTVASGITPSSGLISIWRYDTASDKFAGYSAQFPSQSDLSTLKKLDAVFVCMNAAGSFMRPQI